MTSESELPVGEACRQIAVEFAKLGATAYGGPAMMGVMQAELQEKRQWVSKERFVEGLSLVNLLPGPAASQLAIFLGYARGGWLGGVLGGLCFMLPSFGFMLALTIIYAHLGSAPLLRGGLYGLGPIVLASFIAAVYRLGRSTIRTVPQTVIMLMAAAALASSPFGAAPILAIAAGAGLLLFHSRRVGASVLLVLAAALASARLVGWSPFSLIAIHAQATPSNSPAVLAKMGLFFFGVGGFTFGGGLTMIAFVQEQVVNQFHWLSQQEFIDGLALSQFTPGPLLMVAAYIGYRVGGLAGAVTAAVAIFLPSFLLMLSILPVIERVRRSAWTRAAMGGVGPAVIGVLGVSLARLAPHAVPDLFAGIVLAVALVALLTWRIAVMKLVVAGVVVGMLRSRLGLLVRLRAAF